MKKQLLFICLLLHLGGYAFSQTGINTRTPDAKTILHIDESGQATPVYKGVLLAKYSTTERNATFTGLTATDNGLMIYNTTENCYNYWQQGGATGTWISICGCGPVAASPLLFYARCNEVAVPTLSSSASLSGTLNVPITVVNAGAINAKNQTINGIVFTLPSSSLTTASSTLAISYSGKATTATAINLPITDNNGFTICTVVIPVN